MVRIRWSRLVLAALAGEIALLVSFAFFFGNPISRRLLYTPQAGQSPKLLSVWLNIQLVPVATPFWEQFLSFNARKIAVLAAFYLWTLGLAFACMYLANKLPAHGWRKGLIFGGLLWIMAMPIIEFFFPFNMFGEPFRLVLFELVLEVGVALSMGVAIAALGPDEA